MSEESKQKQTKFNVGASATGAGSGTLIIIIANNLPQGSTVKELLTNSAPSIAVTISALTTYLITKIKKHLEEKEIEKKFAEAKNLCIKTLKNTETSTEHKNNIRQALEELEILETDAKVQSLKKIINTNISNRS